MRPLLRAIKPNRSMPPKRRLIVTEEGAQGFSAFVSADEAEETLVVAQGAEEAAVVLPFRVMARLALMGRSGRSVDSATILVGDRLDGESVAARELVARALLAHMVAAGSGDLAFAAYGAVADLRHDLMTLVEALLNEHEGIPVALRLRFLAEEARPAGSVRGALTPGAKLAS